MDSHLAFALPRKDVRDLILIPKFYDPDLRRSEKLAAKAGFELVELRDLLLPGSDGSRLGDWVRREHYGGGSVPYVRTSDLSQWRIRADFKKGVSEAIWRSYRSKQDIRSLDLLFVAHGTYLVGTVGIVMPGEEKLVLQDHVFRLRPNPASGVSPYLLLALLSTAFVRRQVRARQFSADIIDKIGDRHLGLKIPLPKSQSDWAAIANSVEETLSVQSEIRSDVRALINSDLRMTRERAHAKYGFSVQRCAVERRILIPKYYDPDLEADLRDAEMGGEEPWVTVGELVERNLLELSTGVEVGKMAYGTGDIPFVRTSDIADWEVKRDVKHGVSRAIFDEYCEKASIEAGDVLLVRDGTYLVGSSALVMPRDVPALYCGGIYRLRSKNPTELDPNSLLAILQLPLVRRQMRSKQFTRDVIDTLGTRILEVRIPSPVSGVARRLGKGTAAIMEKKTLVREQIEIVLNRSEPPKPPEVLGRPGWSMR